MWVERVALEMLSGREVEAEAGADERLRGLGIGISGEDPAFVALVAQDVHQGVDVELGVGGLEAEQGLDCGRERLYNLHGCSLGVGSAAPDGSRLVYHSNVGGDSAQQAAALASALPGGKKWEKTDYQTEKLNGYSGFSQYLKSTAIGVRRADTWTFWAQVYEWVKAGTHDETVTLGADAGAFAGLTKTVTKEVTKIYLRDVRKIA